MANFDFDQAEGLRRMLAGPRPRIVTFLSAVADDAKGAMLVNLGASLVGAGGDVLLVDARASTRGVAGRSGAPSLLDVARQECALDQALHQMSEGFHLVSLTHSKNQLRSAASEDDTRRLANVFDLLAKQAGIVVVDAELGADDSLPIPAIASSEIVVQVSTSAASIKSAYSLIKRLSNALGRRPFSLLVTGASELEAKQVFDNIAQAASRYLAIQLISVGSVPADEHLNRAAHLGRAVIDAFPLAGASVAFRRLAGRLALPDMSGIGLRGKTAGSGRNIGI